MITRPCPECGVTFTPHHHAQTFCTTKHQQAFHKLMAKRGQIMVPFALVWRRGKHGKNRDDASFSMQTHAQLTDAWNAEDRAAGRDPTLIVAAKRAAKWKAVDVL